MAWAHIQQVWFLCFGLSCMTITQKLFQSHRRTTPEISDFKSSSCVSGIIRQNKSCGCSLLIVFISPAHQSSREHPVSRGTATCWTTADIWILTPRHGNLRSNKYKEGQRRGLHQELMTHLFFLFSNQHFKQNNWPISTPGVYMPFHFCLHVLEGVDGCAFFFFLWFSSHESGTSRPICQFVRPVKHRLNHHHQVRVQWAALRLDWCMTRPANHWKVILFISFWMKVSRQLCTCNKISFLYVWMHNPFAPRQSVNASTVWLISSAMSYDKKYDRENSNRLWLVQSRWISNKRNHSAALSWVMMMTD